MNQRDRKSPCLIFGCLFCMLCFSIQLFTGFRATIVSNDSISSLMEELENYSFKYNFPIYRIYKLANASYNDYVLLTEHPYSTTGKIALNDSIQAFCIRIADGKYTQKWALKDFIIKNPNNFVAESTIWFWSKYILIEDIYGDGETDFIIVYGTKGLNGIDDGRLKILVYYKDQKCAIRHQNGVLDFERQTQIDSLFYSLPESIQDSTIHLIRRIIQDGNAILAYGWQNAIRNKKVIIMEENQNSSFNKKEKKNQKRAAHFTTALARLSDVVASSLALHHLITDEDKRLFYSKIFNMLKMDGIFLNADVVLGSNEHFQNIYMGKWIFYKNKLCSMDEINNN